MDIQSRKLNLVQEFLRLNNEQLIRKLEKLLFQEKKKIYESELKPYTIEVYNALIDQAISDSKSGKVVAGRALRNEINSWE